ncbi:hypothetical protein [Arthrobacter sp. NPDC090010]|uniref:hypothetical protein n=1 Tax=Arthrobacter sp. NPDC090010 TaxID=3363942 RepID=UPI00381CA246
MNQTSMQPSGTGTKQITRRTVTRGAAWSLPVIAATMAAPAAVASVPPAQQNVIITAGCYGINILGVGQSFPEFTITAVGAPILAGSTFNIQGTGLGNLTFGNANGAGFLNIINGTTAQFTLSQDIPAGSSITLRVTGLLSAQVLRTYTMSVGNVLGNANSIHSDDSAGTTLLGVSVFGILVGYCGRS